MMTHGVSVHPEVFKQAALAKVLPDSVAKELKKCRTIVDEHMNAVTPMDVGTHHEYRDGEVPWTKQRVQRPTRLMLTAASTAIRRSQADPYASRERTSREDGKPKASPRRKGQFDGLWYNGGKTGHRSRDCWSATGKDTGTGEQKGKGGYAKSMDTQVGTTTAPSAATRESQDRKRLSSRSACDRYQMKEIDSCRQAGMDMLETLKELETSGTRLVLSQHEQVRSAG